MRVISQTRLATVLSRLDGERRGAPRIVTSGNYAVPQRVLDVLDKAVAEFRLFILNAQPGIPERPGVTFETAFVGAGMRHRPTLRYFPCRLSLLPALLKQAVPPDAVVIHTSVPADGTVSLGTEVNILPAAIEAARDRGAPVIAQLNPQMPYTYGDAVIDVEDIDYALEADEPLGAPATPPASATSQVIAARVAELVPEGAALQLGIGAVPDAVLARLTERRGLSVWTEMFSDGVLGLERAGALDRNTPVTASFLFGSHELYEWVHRNHRIRLLRTEKTNDPARIARRHAMVSVNTALQVDLYAQANATWVRDEVYSGFGGQTDFVVGALHSRGGQAIIALPSWHQKAQVSTVVPRLNAPVTSFQHSWIVSEQGSAAIWCCDAAGQARQIVDNVAHPDAREGLREAGRELGFPLR